MKKMTFLFGLILGVGLFYHPLEGTAQTRFSDQLKERFLNPRHRNLTPEPNWLNARFAYSLAQQAVAQRPTDTRSRLVSWTEWEYDGVLSKPLDSFRFYWSGHRYNDQLPEQLHFLGLGYPDIMKDLMYEVEMLPIINIYLNMNADSSIIYNYDEVTDTYEPETKFVLALDGQGRSTMLTASDWTGTGWDLVGRLSFTYNSGGHLTMAKIEEWDGSAWINTSRISYTYDANDQIIEELEEGWDNVTSSWESSSRKYYEYNGSQLTLAIEQYNNGSGLENYIRRTFNYDANSNRMDMIEDDWSNSISSWVKYQKIEYSYNSSNQVNHVNIFQWSGSSWDKDLKLTLEYGAGSGKIEKRVIQEWSSSAWQYYSKTECAYTNGKLSDYQLAYWDNGAGEFDNNYRLTYDYNSYHQIVKNQEWFWDGTNWGMGSYSGKRLWHYQEFDAPDGINQMDHQIKVVLYPNPSKEQLQINSSEQQITTLRVLDLNGRVLQVPFKLNGNNATLSTSHLANGTYLLEIFSQDQKGSKLFSVQR